MDGASFDAGRLDDDLADRNCIQTRRGTIDVIVEETAFGRFSRSLCERAPRQACLPEASIESVIPTSSHG